VPRPLPSASDLAERLLRGDRATLSRCITYSESLREDHYALARDVLVRVWPHTGKSVRLGITGIPGAGKSTFIEAWGMHRIAQGKRVAVLAIDPSSEVSGGSILGDKTRMEELANHPAAFVRPSPTSGTLGGITLRTREAIALCEAAGYDEILVETVGVGQSETAVQHVTDALLVLLLPRAGDELQGLKRGIVEAADVLAVHKADGGMETEARHTREAYRQAIALRPHDSWWPPVVLASSISPDGHHAVDEALNRFLAHQHASGEFQSRRTRQAVRWMEDAAQEYVLAAFRASDAVQTAREGQLNALKHAQTTPLDAARALVRAFRESP